VRLAQQNGIIQKDAISQLWTEVNVELCSDAGELVSMRRYLMKVLAITMII